MGEAVEVFEEESELSHMVVKNCYDIFSSNRSVGPHVIAKCMI